ncbi:MAG: M23 family metallopeptidase [Micropepsaceae bacterium]
MIKAQSGRTRRVHALTLALAGLVSGWTASAAPKLALPIACRPGSDCFIQNYVDRDPSAGVSDYKCGSISYEGHKGTDIRLRNTDSMNRGVNVLAAARGSVKAVRDGMKDVSIRRSDASELGGRECGNGVVIDHGDGWVTQYCHMQKGSIRVKSGASVSAGAILGRVGMSGYTQFAHLHFEVRHAKTIVDPFSGSSAVDARTAGCNAKPKSPLWTVKAQALLAYQPVTLVSAGFASRAPTLEEIEESDPDKPSSVAPALIAYVRVIGIRKGDMETLVVTDALNQTLAEVGPKALEKSKAQWLSFAGRKRTVPSWPLGKYIAHYTLERKGKTLIDKEFSLSLVR